MLPVIGLLAYVPAGIVYCYQRIARVKAFIARLQFGVVVRLMVFPFLAAEKIGDASL